MRLARRRAAGQAGFTLLEIIVAMGVLAIGLTAAFALLVAGATSGRKAEHKVNSTLIAQRVINDLRGDLSLNLDLTQFPLASADQNPPPGFDPAAVNPETRWLARDAVWSVYPDYRYDVAITPLLRLDANGDPDPNAEPWEFLIEVEVFWLEKGQGNVARYATILVRGLTHRDNPVPTR
jgi:prepilin-type N-terminal cleavage/methylation domain-containing protein